MRNTVCPCANDGRVVNVIKDYMDHLFLNLQSLQFLFYSNMQKEVVMMQEAKQECYGKWYLPAGRMEQNETIVEAVKREVQEETGLECEPYTLLSVEERGPRWIRFVFLARVTGLFCSFWCRLEWQ